MPSKFTENYKLNLWDAADRVLHEDFNEDNRRIDAALQAQRFGRLETLYSITVPAGTEGIKSIDFDMTDIRPQDWFFWLAGCSANSHDHTLLTINDDERAEFCLFYTNRSATPSSDLSPSNHGYGTAQVNRSGLFLFPTVRSAIGLMSVMGYDGNLSMSSTKIDRKEIRKISFWSYQKEMTFWEDMNFFLLGAR